MRLVARDDGWRIPDEVWERMEPLLPPRPAHPLGCHNPRVPDREAMNAILLVLRTGMQWNALTATGMCSSSSAHRRFQEWAKGGRVRAVLAAGTARLRPASGHRVGVAFLRRGDGQGTPGRRADRSESH